MARIRTIKPEFPQSESMGRISRDARLTFIQLWTLADDDGRLRGNSRMLASLLFPYDEDARELIGGWLDELDGEGCIVRYKVDGDSYIQICNWLIHQKVDKPSKSKIPPFDEGSRILANPRERSSGDLRIKDQGSEDLRTKGSEDLVLDAARPTRKTVSREAEDSEFLELKLAYPERSGDYRWKQARSACNARIAEGHAWREIVDGAKRYAEFCRAAGKFGTEYVMQAARFCGTEKPFLLPWKPPPKAETASERILRLNGDDHSRIIEHEPDTPKFLESH